MIEYKNNIVKNQQLYKLINGIKSDGTSYLVIDHVFKNVGGRVICEFTMTGTPTTDSHFFGAHNFQSGQHFAININSSIDTMVYSFSGAVRIPFQHNIRHTLDMCNNSNGSYISTSVGGGEIFQTSKATSCLNAKFLLFAANDYNGGSVHCRGLPLKHMIVHSLKVWDGDQMIADLIPVKSKHGYEDVIAFYDNVSEDIVLPQVGQFIEA